MSAAEWKRFRFRAALPDYRPVKWPPLGPYWCSGEGDDYSIIIAYLPANREKDLREFWPEAASIEFTEETEISYSDRFPKPGWWEEIEANKPTMRKTVGKPKHWPPRKRIKAKPRGWIGGKEKVTS